jgi:FKBP-type peptidyl-prolyl isomerase-like protein
VSNPNRARVATAERPLTKAEKRALAKAAAARAAAAQRRRKALTGVLAGLAAVGLVIGLYLAYGGDHKNNDATPNASASAATPGTAGPTSQATFPPLPEGADPALRTKPTTAAGTGELTKLNVTTLIEGKGAPAQARQQITVNYVGVTYRDGEEFDASWKQSKPFQFTLGEGGVIKGWDQGLVGVKVGSRVQLDIPSALAYGDNPGGGRPAGALRFIVDVLAAQ